ncbi:MAG: NAD-dependent succinate-semialdehyde dehydrogenase [Ramlibacter sp.]|nr:NAD-dependent succinate-semialdehyde dehydrogenase [Ramlibacter sp.]
MSTSNDAVATSFAQLGHYIHGEWRKGASRTMQVLDPATGRPIGEIPVATPQDLEDALRSSSEGFRKWRDTAPAQRCAIILAAAQLMRQRRAHIAMVMTMEQGKPIAESEAEVLRAAELIEWAAEEGRRTYGLTIPAPVGYRYLTFAEPLGPVAALTPWNFPAVSPARKVGSALAAGCSCILKPSDLTPCTAAEMTRAFHDAGLPPGVLNLLYGEAQMISQALIASPVVRKVTFTGSVPVGKQLSELAGRHMKPCVMELGGHSPTIVFPDVDVKKIARASAATKYRNSGQVCTSPTRFYVHQDIYKAFTEEFAGAAKALAMGPGRDAKTQMGPVVSERRASTLQRLADDARNKGAVVLAGGGRTDDAGFFFQPTVLSDVPLDAAVMSEEPFGPMAVCRSFSTIEEVVQQANALPYGLAAYLFSGSVHTTSRIARELECGVVGVNAFNGSNPETPFGGVKDSGYGREGGTEGVRSYMATKFVVEGPL